MSAHRSTLDMLNEQQLTMLRLLKKPLPENDFNQLRRLVVQLPANQLDVVIEGWESENQIDSKYYEDLSKLHFRKSPSKQKL